MATKKRTGLGRGIGALIPTKPAGDRPVDVFFPGQPESTHTDGNVTPTSASAQGTGATTKRAEASAEAASAATVEQPEAAPKTATKRTSRSTDPASAKKTRKASTTNPTAADEASDATTKTTPTERPRASARSRRSVPALEPTSSRTNAKMDATADLLGTSRSAAARAEQAAEQAPEQNTKQTSETELVPVPGAQLIEVDPGRIAPNLRQPRTEFDEEALEELTISVREFGVLQPVVVRPIQSDHPSADRADYELIMGERRLRASRAAGLKAIPAIVRSTADEDMLRDALLENLHRAELNPLEEASAYQQLLDDFGITQEELAKRIGRSRPQISNTIRLLRLPVDVQRRVAAGVLSAGHARAILSVNDPAQMTQLADKIINEDLSVRAAEAAAQKHTTRRPTVPAKKPTGGLTGYLDEVGERLGDKLNTRVRVSLRKTKGQIVVDFASINDLNRILGELGVETD